MTWTNRWTIMTIVLVAFLLLILQQCTSVDLLAAFRNKTHRHLPALKNGARSEHFQLQRLSTNVYCNLTYDPIGDFFMLENRDEVIKIDGEGNEVFKLKIDPFYLPRFSHYVFDLSGVYDFSDSKIIKQPFRQLLNLKQELSEETWQQQFDQLYEAADVVLFGFTAQYKNGDPIFFRVNNEWTLLLTTEHEVRLNDMEHQAGITFKGYEAKFKPLFLLKDPTNQLFADLDGTTNQFLETYYTVKLKEKDLSYPSDRKIDRISAEKGRVFASGAYSSIPISWVYPSGQCLKINNEEIKFRSDGIKALGLSTEMESFLNSFVVPSKFADRTKVSFLKYSFPSNGDESDNNGMYVVKPFVYAAKPNTFN